MRGFTLIELLIVVALVALLVGLLLPALAKSRRCVRATKELAAGRQVMQAFTVYADASKGRVLTGYSSAAMVSGATTVTNRAGDRLTGEVAQRYPWRLAPMMDYDFRGLYQSDKVLADLFERQGQYTPYGIDYDYVVSLYPSLGMNVAFVGGSDRLSEFDPAFQRVFGRAYIERIDEARRPGDLIAFGSARADAQPALPFDGAPQGYFRLDPPVFVAAGGSQWEPSYDERAAAPGRNSGFVSLRHDGRAACAMLDGHASLLNWADLHDMRRWADGATSESWGLAPR